MDKRRKNPKPKRNGDGISSSVSKIKQTVFLCSIVFMSFFGCGGEASFPSEAAPLVFTAQLSEDDCRLSLNVFQAGPQDSFLLSIAFLDSDDQTIVLWEQDDLKATFGDLFLYAGEEESIEMDVSISDQDPKLVILTYQYAGQTFQLISRPMKAAC